MEKPGKKQKYYLVKEKPNLNWGNILCGRVVHFLVLSFLQGFFRLIVFVFILQNTLCRIELFAKYRYLLSNCYLGYCVRSDFKLRNEFLLLRRFTKIENVRSEANSAKTPNHFRQK